MTHRALDRVLKKKATALRRAADTLDQFSDAEYHVIADSLREQADDIDPPLPDVQTYYVVHEVRWQPPAGWDPTGDDVIMDYQHSLKVDDPRFIGYGMEAIGGLEEITRWLRDYKGVKGLPEGDPHDGVPCAFRPGCSWFGQRVDLERHIEEAHGK